MLGNLASPAANAAAVLTGAAGSPVTASSHLGLGLLAWLLVAGVVAAAGMILVLRERERVPTPARTAVHTPEPLDPRQDIRTGEPLAA